MYEITNYDWYIYPLKKGGKKIVNPSIRSIDPSIQTIDDYIPILVGEVDLTLEEARSHRDFSIHNFRLPSGLAPIYALMYGVPLSDPMVAGCHFNDSLDIIRFNCNINTQPYDMWVNITDPTGSYSLGGSRHYWQPSPPGAGSFNALWLYFPVIHTKDDYYIPLKGSFWSFLEINGASISTIKQYTSKDRLGYCIYDGELSLDNGYINIYDSTSLEKAKTYGDPTIRKMLKISKRTDPDDPYDGGDDKGDDDNNPGNYDHTSDVIREPDLPSVSVTDSGLVTLFAPTESQLKALADYLWSDAFSLDNFKKMLNNPMDCILGLTIIPVNVPHGMAREITVGNIVTTVSCNICPTQYVRVDCGTFTFDRHDMTNSYLDYSPYSKCYLYLPFIGVQEINIDDFMQSTMHIVYHVDILTGAMFCYVMRDGSVMYTYMGQCAENVPLSSSSYSNTIGSIMSAAASIIGVASVAATGGATAPVAAGLLGSATTSTANAVTSLKPSVAHSGSIGGGAGIMGVNYPYLIFNTPHISIPSQQRHYTGYPSNQIVKLSALKGFNVIQAINLSVSGANDSEMNEIENILKGGVIL